MSNFLVKKGENTPVEHEILVDETPLSAMKSNLKRPELQHGVKLLRWSFSLIADCAIQHPATALIFPGAGIGSPKYQKTGRIGSTIRNA